MIRKSTLNINYANRNKLNQLDEIFIESKRVINLIINHLWEVQDFKSKFMTHKVDTWLSARMQQCLGKQALEIVKSQRKRLKKTKPVFTKDTIELDQRFITINQTDNGEFDIWFKLQSIGNRIINIPSHKHIHFNKYKYWNIKKSIKLRKNNKGYFIDVYFEKQFVPKQYGDTIGLDCGYKKLLVDSNGTMYGKELESIYEKISKKKQGSKQFKRTLIERDNKINQVVNSIDLSEINKVVVEKLKNVKHKTSNKINKQFNNKLQRWSYSKTLNKLALLCEESGIEMVNVSPAYTSQTCSCCGSIDKTNRQGEKYQCKSCSLEIDADYNAAINILHRGIYSSSNNEEMVS